MQRAKNSTLLTKGKSKYERPILVVKILEVFTMRGPAERHPANHLQVTVNCGHPGSCYSEVGRKNAGCSQVLFKTSLVRSTEAGSRTFMHAVSTGSETWAIFG